MDLPERVDNFFSLIVCCSFPTVSRWPLAFTYQQIFLCLLLISTQNLSINENDLLKYSSKSKPPYFISIFFKLQSYFFSNCLNVHRNSFPGNQILRQQLGRFVYFQKSDRANVQNGFLNDVWFIKAGFYITFTFLIHDENKPIRRNIILTLRAFVMLMSLHINLTRHWKLLHFNFYNSILGMKFK